VKTKEGEKNGNNFMWKNENKADDGKLEGPVRVCKRGKQESLILAGGNTEKKTSAGNRPFRASLTPRGVKIKCLH